MFDNIELRRHDSKVKRPRAFKRDGYLGIRMPGEDKDRLRELARKLRRDTSSVALEGICKHMVRLESEFAKQVVTQ